MRISENDDEKQAGKELLKLNIEIINEKICSFDSKRQKLLMVLN